MTVISVIVCTKNEEKTIENCLKILNSQKIRPEIIVVDGYSIDNTVSIAKRYADKILYDNHKGLGDARDLAVDFARGDIIAYCDADSQPSLEWTEDIIKNIEGFDAISGPVNPYDGNLIMRLNFKLWADLFPRFLALFRYNNIWGANMAFKKDTLKKFKFKLKFLEDYYMGKQIRKSKGKIKFTKSMALPISSRRFENGFYLTCYRFYIKTFLKMLIHRNNYDFSFSGYY